MKLGIVIPSYNNLELLRKLLLQLPQIPEFCQSEVVVVDNGSQDGTSEMVKTDFPDYSLLTLPENTGGSGGFIAGVKYAMSLDVDYIWLLDDDVKIKNDTLSKLLDAAANLDADNVKWGCIGSLMANLSFPEQVVESGAEVLWCRGGFKLYNRGKKVDDVAVELLPVQYCAAASLLTRPQVINDIGFFENIFIHYDDVDWCMRMSEAGYNIFCNTASVFWHATIKDAPVTWVRYYDCRNFLWLCLRHNQRKWFYWGVLKMLCKALYFKMHRMPDISKLYLQGIRDAYSGQLLMRSELGVEKKVVFTTIKPKLEGRRLAGIFYDNESIERFKQSYPENFKQMDKVFCFNPQGFASDWNKCKLTQLPQNLKLFFYMLFHPRTVMIYDGMCCHNFMLPPLYNDTVYIFSPSNLTINRIKGAV